MTYDEWLKHEESKISTFSEKEQDSRLKPTLNHDTNPGSVTFTWKDDSITVQLHEGEDILKLAQLLSEFLTNNGISNTLIKKNL